MSDIESLTGGYKVVRKANSLFRSGSYLEAERLYYFSSSIYGNMLFESNIEQCRKLLSNKQEEDKGKSFINNYFDKVYLVNLEKDVEKKVKSSFQLRRHKIDFEIFNAVNGYEGDVYKGYLKYKERPLGVLKKFSDYSSKEKERRQPYITSAGAWGYIHTYISIIKDARQRGFEKILILEDDVVLHDLFSRRAELLIKKIGEGWRLIHFGASEYEWESVNVQDAVEKGFYYPRKDATNGSFAMAINCMLFDEIINLQSYFEAPFDHLPLWEIYEKHSGDCYVSYPNIAMPDVTTSSIRHSRDQSTHGHKMKWVVNDFPFPLKNPLVCVVLPEDGECNLDIFNDSRLEAIDLLVCKPSVDGYRPVHDVKNIEGRGGINFKLMKVGGEGRAALPEADLYIYPEKGDGFTGQQVFDLIVDSKENSLNLSLNLNKKNNFVKGRVSVVIPTYKCGDELYRALISVAEQDYLDKEVIVVSDNPEASEYAKVVLEKVDLVKAMFPSLRIILIQHKYNRNGAAARNTGLYASSGEYISFLDDDDIYLPGRLDACIRELRCSGPAVGGVYCGFKGWNSFGNDLARYPQGNFSNLILTLDYKKHYLCTNTATFRRDAIMRVNGFDESYRRHQDLEFNLRFMEKYYFGVVKDCLVELKGGGQDNKLYGSELLDLKVKFLSDFSQHIKKYVCNIEDLCKIHYKEVAKYSDASEIRKAYGDFSEEFVMSILMESALSDR